MHTLTQTDDYALLLQQAQALLEDEPDLLANLANIAALVYHSIPQINWVGFYIYKDNQLVLGPFQGLPACTRIQMGKGVCGTAAQTRRIQNVLDVHLFPGHIACDSASNSEVVIPVLFKQQLYGVFDIDSPNFNRFDPMLQTFLEDIVDLIEQKNG